jgi:hypothetical protein
VHYKVGRNNIRDWKKKEKELRSCAEASLLSAPKKRLPGAGRHLHNQQFDDELIEWCHQRRKKKMRVTRRIIQQQALKMSLKIDETEFDDEVEFKVLILLKFFN